MPQTPYDSTILLLLLEDDSPISISLEDILNDEGFTVQPFASCAQALQWLKEVRPDGAILYVSLRGETCLEVARELQGLSVPFVIYSGRHRSEKLLPGFDHVPWLEKPCSFRDILAALEDVMPAAQRRRQA